jgi:methanogenic corrinoid protein MtbC1
MVTSGLVHRLLLVVQSIMQTQTIHSQFTVIELMREDGNLDQIRAYMVDKITTLA